MREKREVIWKQPFNEKESIGSFKTGVKDLGWDEFYDEYWNGIREILQCETAFKTIQHIFFLTLK